jgi:hypothetical protein
MSDTPQQTPVAEPTDPFAEPGPFWALEPGNWGEGPGR